MKRCRLLYWIVGMMLCVMLCSCGAAPQEPQSTGRGQMKLDSAASPSTADKDAEAGIDADATGADRDEEPLKSVYSELMGGIYDLILAEDLETDQELAGQALNGILEAGYSRTPEETLEYVGYTLQDLNADGMPELIIGGIAEERDGNFFGRDIYAVYTCVQEKLHCVCSGWSRSYVGWMGENVFYYLGSGGAAYTIVGQYELLPNAAEWSCIDLYFTDEENIYHNQTGIYDLDEEYAEVVDMTWDALWEFSDELADQVLEFELTPFSTCAS